MIATSQTFNARRFVILTRSQWRSQLRHYLSWLLVCTMLAVPVLGLQVVGMTRGQAIRFVTTEQAGLYATGLLLLGAIFAAQHFGPMRRREHALLVLMQPASVTEKWALAAVTVLLAFPLVYTLWFALLVTPVATLSFWWDTQIHLQRMSAAVKEVSDAPTAAAYALYLPFRNPEDRPLEALVFVCHLGLTGLAVTGSLLFRRAPFLLTLLTGFLVMLGIMFVSLFSPEGSGATRTLFRWWFSKLAEPTLLVEHALNAWLWLGVPCLLWVTAWRALKERELA